MRRGYFIGRLHIVMVDQFARQDTALKPPGIGIDQRCAIGRCFQHHRGSFRKLLVSAQIFGFGECISGRTLLGRNGGEQFGCALVIANDCCPGFRKVLCAGKFSYAIGGIDSIGIEHAFHAGTMICLRQHIAKLFDDPHLVTRIELFGAPEWRQHRVRFFDFIKCDVRARKQYGALKRLWGSSAECLDDGSRVGTFAIKRPLGVAAQRFRAGPVGKRCRGCGNFRARHVRAAVHGDRPCQDMPVEAGRRQPLTELSGFADLICGQGVEAVLQIVDLLDRHHEIRLPGHRGAVQRIDADPACNRGQKRQQGRK